MRRFSAWLAEEGEIDEDPLLGLNAPKLDSKVTDSLTDDELRRLLRPAAAATFAIGATRRSCGLMAETGMRAGELLDLTVGDVDLVRGIVAVRRGKGGKGRLTPFPPQTGRAVDRYIRARRGQLRADFPELWLESYGWNWTPA